MPESSDPTRERGVGPDDGPVRPGGVADPDRPGNAQAPGAPDEPVPGVDVDEVPVDDAIIGRAFAGSLAVFALIAVVVVAVLLLRGGEENREEIIERDPIDAPDRLAGGEAEMPDLPFTDVTASAGIDFRHESGVRGEKLLPETMGGGAAFLDYDGDGDQDLLLLSGTWWPDDPRRAAGETPPTSRLYRNDGGGRFEDVTDAAGLADLDLYAMSAAVGDVDADGDEDLFIAALGRDRLLLNENGRFVDATDAAGVAGPGDWSCAAAFLDHDADGDLDLWVTPYVAWTRELDFEVNYTLNGRDRAYGPPNNFPGTHSRLFRNDGDGRFTDVSAEAGLHVVNPSTGRPLGKGLAIAVCDVDRDGRVDVAVANDTTPNFLFRNRGDGTFEEVASSAGMAFDGMGATTGAMGIDVADAAGDGGMAVAIGNFANEPTSFFVQQPRDPWSFADMAGIEGIGSPSRLRLSFGLFFFDADLDGRLDLLQANGHLEEEISTIHPSQSYRQPAQLFWNQGPDARYRFAEVPPERTGDLADPIVGRAAAFADVDGDGDLDVVLTQPGAAPHLLRNDQATGHRWVRLRLLDTDGSTAGARHAEVEIDAGGRTQRARVMPTRSYLSSVESVLTFGLGDAERIDAVRIHWPDGTEQALGTLAPDRVHVIRQPRGG